MNRSSLGGARPFGFYYTRIRAVYSYWPTPTEVEKGCFPIRYIRQGGHLHLKHGAKMYLTILSVGHKHRLQVVVFRGGTQIFLNGVSGGGGGGGGERGRNSLVPRPTLT